MKHGFSVEKRIRHRTALRRETGWLAPVSSSGLHYSRNWDDAHFVQLNLYAADAAGTAARYCATWRDPQGALSFLCEDPAADVTERRVVLLTHCGCDTDWWTPVQWEGMCRAVAGRRVAAWLFGHTGTGVRRWAPPGETNAWLCHTTPARRLPAFCGRHRGGRGAPRGVPREGRAGRRHGSRGTGHVRVGRRVAVAPHRARRFLIRSFSDPSECVWTVVRQLAEEPASVR